MSSDRDVVIRTRNLSKAYPLYASQNDWLKQVLLGSLRNYHKSFWALRGIDLEIRRGDSVGVLGRNGCGKSTLLQIVCGITRPTKGELWVKGRVAPVLALGATFDQESTGRENVLMAGAIMRLKRAEILEKFDAIADFAGIGDYMYQPLKHYSSGMRTRLAFAICAQVEAEILIVDEALAVGDAAFQRKCLDWIDRFRQRGTLLFVSHSPPQVQRLCKHAVWIDNGRIRQQGIPRDVIRSYTSAMQHEEEDVGRFAAEPA